MSGLRPEATKAVAVAPGPAAQPVCADCGAPTGSNFCPACGQETRLEIPGIGRFIGEIANEQFGIEGRLGRTLWALLFKPGKLTAEFIAGRRQRYIRPARLYLSASVLFFGLLGLTSGSLQVVHIDDKDANVVIRPDKDAQPAEGDSAKDADEDSTDSKPKGDAGKGAGAAAPMPKVTVPKVAMPLVSTPKLKVQIDPLNKSIPPPGNPSEGGDTKTVGEAVGVDQKKLEDMKLDTGNAALNARLKSRLGGIMSTPKKDLNSRVVRTLLDDAPIMMFVLLPVFAGCLKLFYVLRHLRYGVHLLFAVHFHTFVFLDLLLRMLPWPKSIKDILILTIPIYLGLALRRLYGSGFFGILWRMFALAVINGICMCFVALFALIFSALMFGLG